MTTSDKQQSSRALDTLGNLRQALCGHTDARSNHGWAGSSAERKKLARVAREVMQAACAEAWHNLGPSLDQSVGHLWGHLEVYADVDSRFVAGFAEITLAKIEDVEQALRSRLDGSFLVFPVTASELTRLAGLKDVRSVTNQMDNVIDRDRQQRGERPLAKRKRGRGQVPSYSEAQVSLFPHLHDRSRLKHYLVTAYENK